MANKSETNSEFTVKESNNNWHELEKRFVYSMDFERKQRKNPLHCGFKPKIRVIFSPHSIETEKRSAKKQPPNK